MKKKTMLMIIGIIGLIVITVGVTYAFFSYTKEGTTENTIKTGTITFLYTETDQVGAGISLTDAFPMSDTQGKALTGDLQVFDFKITSTTPTTAGITYEITARKKIVENMLDEEAVRIYLTKSNGTEEEVLLDNYSNLTQTTKVSENKYIEKTLHTDRVPSNSTNYEQAYRLRMWVDEDIDFSPVKDENGNDTYPYNNKTFTVTVNVYANAKVVTEEDLIIESNTEIESVSVNDSELTSQANEEYDYAAVLPDGTETATLNIKTINPYSRVSVEKIDSSTAYESNATIKRLSSSKNVSLTSGDNYFKVTVTSENGNAESEYIVNIFVQPNCDELIGKTYNYSYSGNEQKLRIVCDGNYKLETWGAQGGSYSTTYHGGYGGYSVGTTNLETLTNLYINVGGAGKTLSSTGLVNGGYNGGGSSTASSISSTGSGGGATHIALKSGLLSKLKNYTDKILIVSGGGGGSHIWNPSSTTNYAKSIGGSGGGYIGVSSKTTYKLNSSSFAGEATGGTQTQQGKTGGAKKSWGTFGLLSNGGFGLGAYFDSSYVASDNGGHAGGGGGLYGGGHGAALGGGGGSSYIKNPLLKNKVMYCYNCSTSSAEATKTISTTNVSDTATTNYVKKGNGYARITYLGE